MTKSELWNEIKTKYKFVNNTELLNSTGKTYAQVTKKELRKYYNQLIDVEIEVDEIVANLAKEMELEGVEGVNEDLSNDDGGDTVATVETSEQSLPLIDYEIMREVFTSLELALNQKK